MKIMSLGHSSFIVEIEGDRPEPLRILADPWITDHVVGDMCGRFPRIRIDFDQLPPIDAIYISHSHTDHLDPYSLVMLRDRLPRPPQLILPISIAYLEPLFAEHLAGWPRTWLSEDSPIEIHGVEVSALFNLDTAATNEDDVMVLVVRNGHEVLVSESDALLPFHDPEARECIASLFFDLDDSSGPPNRVFLTTRNELEATMASMRAVSPEHRREIAAESASNTLDQCDQILSPAMGELMAPWDLPGAVRLLIGQGIVYPQQLDPDWNRVLFPISIEDRAKFESDVASSYGLDLPIHAVEGGRGFEIDGGVVTPCELPWLETLDSEEDRRFDPTVERYERELQIAPLHDDPRDAAEQRERIRCILNDRFLPYWIGSRNPPVEHLLARHGGEYRIRIRYGTSREFEVEDYVASYTQLRFVPADPAEDPEDVDEEYWGNDLEDYLDGHADDFSTFCRRSPGGHSTRLWDSLGMPYLNDDLVAKKHAYHFGRAEAGESSEGWVLGIWRGDAGSPRS